MPKFHYSGYDSTGKEVEGQAESDSREALAGQLVRLGIMPNEIVPAAIHIEPGVVIKRLLNMNAIKADEMVIFARQMYTLMKAGVPITKAIKGLSQSTRSDVLARSLSDIVIALDSGRELSSAMNDHKHIFSAIFINMVKVGENTGKLDEAFLRLAGYTEFEINSKKQIKSATRYPMMVMITITAAIIIINIWVIPAFAQLFSSMGAELPWATRVLIFSSNFMLNYWGLLLTIAIGGFIGIGWLLRTPKGRRIWDEFKLKIPVFGSIWLRSSLARFARSFAMATRSGVPLLQTLSVVSKAVDNGYIADKIIVMRESIQTGESLSQTATATGLFTPLILQMISVGEETGEIDNLIDDVGAFYEREVEYDIARLGDTIEPLLIAVIAVIVLILAMGVFLPMWELSSAVKA